MFGSRWGERRGRWWRTRFCRCRRSQRQSRRTYGCCCCSPQAPPTERRRTQGCPLIELLLLLMLLLPPLLWVRELLGAGRRPLAAGGSGVGSAALLWSCNAAIPVEMTIAA